MKSRSWRVGAVLNCLGRRRLPCRLAIWSTPTTTQISRSADLTFRSPNSKLRSNSAFAGVLVTNTAANGTYKTFTTATAHNFRPGDMVTVRFTDDLHYWGDGIVYDCGSGSSAAACTVPLRPLPHCVHRHLRLAATPGVVALGLRRRFGQRTNTQFDGITSAGAGNYSDSTTSSTSATTKTRPSSTLTITRALD